MGNCNSHKTHHNEERFKPTHSVRGNIIRQRTNKNVLRYYRVVSTVGVGSISTITKVERIRPARTEASSNCNKVISRVATISNFLLRKDSDANALTRPKIYYALKTIDLQCVKEIYIDELINEIDILKNLDHPNIVKAYELFEYKNKISVVMELCTGGDLHARKPYTEESAAKLARKTLRAVSYMHELGVVHRDIKFENIIFENTAPEAEIKLIDFGLAKKYSAKRLMTERVGTIYSMAPQVIQGVYTSQADMWSVGVVIYMMLSGRHPFWGRTRASIINEIMRCNYNFDGPSWSHVSEEAKSFVSSLLKMDPQERLTAKQALQSPWLDRVFPKFSVKPIDVVLREIYSHLPLYEGISDFKKIALMVIAHKSSIDEIFSLREAFKAVNKSNSGSISLAEFQETFAQFNASEDQLKRMFESIDINDDGRIGYTEFLAATIETQGEIQAERIAEAFDRIDQDDTGYICKTNLRDILGTKYTEDLVYKMLQEVGGYDGNITYKDFLSAFLTPNQIGVLYSNGQKESLHDENTIIPGGKHELAEKNLDLSCFQ